MKTAAIFDVDWTLTKEPVGYKFFVFLNSKGKFSNESMHEINTGILSYINKEINYIQLCEIFDHAVIKGLYKKSVIEIEEEAKKFLDKESLYFDYSQKLVNLFSDKHKIFISSSISEIVSLVADDLGADYIIASKIRQKNGVYLDCIEVSLSKENAKKILVQNYALRNNINLKKSFGFGDSEHDSHLEIVGHPIVLNPNPEFREAASKNGWKILYENDDVVWEVQKELSSSMNSRCGFL